MKKKFILTGVAAVAFCNAFAGGLLTNTNQSVHFLRNPARDASTEIDAAYTNPAGLAFLPTEGFHFSVNNQSAFQTRTITAEFAPFAGFGGEATKKFEGKTSAPFVPSLQAAYKTGNWTFSANLSIEGGGGTVDFKTGLPSFEAQVAQLPLAANAAVGANLFSGYSVESQLKGSSIIYGAQAGATYRVNENFSAYLGVRYSYVDNGYEGYLKNLKIGFNNNLLSAEQLIAANPGFSPIAANMGNKEVDLTQTGSGIAPIIGLDYQWNGLNLAAKYEFKTAIDVKNKTVEGKDAGMDAFKESVKTPYDIPALLTVGAAYDILPALTVSAGYHHFFDSDAKASGDKQNSIHGGINEYLAGVEYRIHSKFLVSAGGQITRTGVKDAYQSDLAFSLNSYSLGLGGAINVTENIRVNLAYFFTNYEDYSVATPLKETFGRTNQSFGIGVDFRF